MIDPSNYFPGTIFGPEGETAPRVMVAPQRYIQGAGVIDHTGRYLSLLNAKRVALLASARGHQAEGMRVADSLKSENIDVVPLTFGGECSLEEIGDQFENLKNESVDCLVAMGGGKCVDTGKSIAERLGVPVVVIPTLASNDAPCSALSVIYSSQGVSSGVEFFKANPNMVIIDTGVVASASERYLVAGMGDAMATWYEARACATNPNGVTAVFARPTLAACALGEICAKTLYEDGEAASRAVAANEVNDSVERIVEANTLLSGIGFESGGLAVAHGIAQSYTEIPIVHASYLHGEMVAMGTLTQLMMESEDEAKRVAEFFARVGLPIHLGQMSLGIDDTAALETIAQAAMEFPFIQNMPLDVTPELLRDSIEKAHELGVSVASTEGDSAYRKLHQST
jgi:glycerol dehydrogenase